MQINKLAERNVALRESKIKIYKNSSDFHKKRMLIKKKAKKNYRYFFLCH